MAADLTERTLGLYPDHTPDAFRALSEAAEAHRAAAFTPEDVAKIVDYTVDADGNGTAFPIGFMSALAYTLGVWYETAVAGEDGQLTLGEVLELFRLRKLEGTRYALRRALEICRLTESDTTEILGHWPASGFGAPPEGYAADVPFRSLRITLGLDNSGTLTDTRAKYMPVIIRDYKRECLNRVDLTWLRRGVETMHVRAAGQITVRRADTAIRRVTLSAIRIRGDA